MKLSTCIAETVIAVSNPLPLANLIRRFRHSAGLSQAELAERAGLSERAVSDLERGLRTSTRPETIRKLSDALELSADRRTELLVAANPELREPAASVDAGATPVNSATINLPIPPTPLIGREQEATHLLDCLLNNGNRLITMTGPGGVGKTRLALEVARKAAAAFSDGAVFVDLAPVADPAQVASTIADVFGIRESGDRPVRDLLRTALAPRHMMLLIDNFEQVIDASPLIATCSRRLHNSTS